MAHILVCLRIAVVVTHAVARLATDLRDCALVGRVSHPLDGISEFQELPNSLSFQTSLSWSHPPCPSPRADAGRGDLAVGSLHGQGIARLVRAPSPREAKRNGESICVL